MQNRNDPDSLSDNHITSIRMDRSGIIWIGTVKGGLIPCLNNQVSFDHFKHNPVAPDSIDHNNVQALLLDREGFLWVGTTTGLNRVNREKGSVAHIGRRATADPTTSLTDIKALFEDSEGFIWCGGSGGKLNRVHPKSGRIDQFALPDKLSLPISLKQIFTIKQDAIHTEQLLLGTNRGILRFNRNSRSFSSFPTHKSISTDLIRCNILSLAVEANGDIWAGSGRNGLFRLMRGARIWEQYVYDLRDRGKGLSNNTVYTMYRDRSDRIWIGTGGGLNLFPEGIGSWRNFSSRHGLPGDTVFSILEDAKGFLWLSTNQGLARFDPKEENFTRFDSASGVQGNLFNPGAAELDKNGSFLFGGTNGYNSFDPEQLAPHPYIPPLAWTGFYINNKPVNPGRPLSEVDQLIISYKSRSIVFEFSALFFLNPGANRYAYLLEGRDADWNPAFSDHTISFASLGWGEYRLRVRCANPDGIWNPDEFQLSLTVIPPFWRTTTAKILFLVTALLLVATWYKKKRKRRGRPSESLVTNLDKLIEKIPITAREEEIVRLIILGESNKDIARKLYISNSTVRNHIYNIYQKLKVKNRLDLINLIQKQK